MENNYKVYKHTNLINNKVYVGITKQKVADRWGKDGSNYKNSPHFWQAIQQYGWNNFSHEIIQEDLTKEQACLLEKELIKKFNSQNSDYGYNITEGGDCPSMTEETKEKISKAMMGNKNGLGKPCSKEKAKKISETQKGRQFTEEHKQKLSLAKKGSHHKSPSEETRKKISDSKKKKPVYCEELNKIFPSIQECARELNIEATSICAVCKGKHKTTHGFHFSYYTEEDM